MNQTNIIILVLILLLFFMVLKSSSFQNPIIKGSWKQMGSDIDGEAGDDESGRSVSLSSDGKRVAIGAKYNDHDEKENAGHVRVYEYKEGEWNQMGSDIDGEAAFDWSGETVSLSSDGTRIAIGAIKNNGNGSKSGHVRVYEYQQGTWMQIGTDIDGEARYDYSGTSVSLSSDGNRVAIGAYKNDADGNKNAGHVRVYQYKKGEWNQMGSDIDGEAAEDKSGIRVSLSSDGTRVAIGARYNDTYEKIDAGHVRVYEYKQGSWNQMGSDIDGEAAFDESGVSVSLSSDGTRVAIGSQKNDAHSKYANYNAGHVRVYEYKKGEWNQMGSDIDGEAAEDKSGTSVSLSSDGTRVAIGARYKNSDGNEDAGSVRLYEYLQGAWKQIGTDINGEAAFDNSGSLSLSGDGTQVAIGASKNDSNENWNAGHVRVFEYQNQVNKPNRISLLILLLSGAYFYIKRKKN